MLIILFLFALIRTLHGVPLASPVDTQEGLIAAEVRDSQVHFGQRGVNDIIISCFATIFACTWSAVHPNIPAPTDSAWTRYKRQITIMIYDLLAPEMIIFWAFSQRAGARRIMDEYNKAIHGVEQQPNKLEIVCDYKEQSIFVTVRRWFETGFCTILRPFHAVFCTISRLFQDSPFPPVLAEGKGPRWTLAHGFFLQMGGFMLCENGQPTQILLNEHFGEGEGTGTIIWNIEHGIIDPPRLTEADIQDRSKGDAISKTLIILQTTWFTVQCVARWSQGLPVTELEIVTLAFAMLNGITYKIWWNKPQNVGRPVFLESKRPRSSDRHPAELDTTSNSSSSILVESGSPSPHSVPVKESWLRRKLRKEMENHAYSPMLLWRIPSRILHAALRPLTKMFCDSSSCTKMRVGMFYCMKSDSDVTEAIHACVAIGILFGSVHLIPSWFLDFSSPQEMWLWRASAIVITSEPLSLALLFYFGEGVVNTISLVSLVSASIGLPLYPIARIMLLMLSLTSLRSLSPAALQTIEWTTYIPHI